VELDVVFLPVVDPTASAGVDILSGVDVHWHHLQYFPVNGLFALVTQLVVFATASHTALFQRVGTFDCAQQNRGPDHLGGSVGGVYSVLGVAVLHCADMVGVMGPVGQLATFDSAFAGLVGEGPAVGAAAGTSNLFELLRQTLVGELTPAAVGRGSADVTGPDGHAGIVPFLLDYVATATVVVVFSHSTQNLPDVFTHHTPIRVTDEGLMFHQLRSRPITVIHTISSKMVVQLTTFRSLFLLSMSILIELLIFLYFELR